MSMLEIFLDKLILHGLESFGRYYGTYRGIVHSNKDPEQRGRVQLSCPDVGASKPIYTWVDPSFSYSGKGVGEFCPPEDGSTVWVNFRNGDPSLPLCYWGGWCVEDGVPKALGYPKAPDEKDPSAPTKRGITTKAGHYLVFNDEPDKEQVKLLWSKADGSKAGEEGSKTSHLSFNNDGNIVVTDAVGTTVTLDAKNKSFHIVDVSKNKIEMKDDTVKVTNKDGTYIEMSGGKVTVSSSSSVTVKTNLCDVQANTVQLAGSADQVPLGQKLLQYLASHTHPTGVGPSGPPITPPLPTLLSTKVKLS